MFLWSSDSDKLQIFQLQKASGIHVNLTKNNVKYDILPGLEMTARGRGIELALIFTLFSSVLSSFSDPVAPEESDTELKSPESSSVTSTLGIVTGT